MKGRTDEHHKANLFVNFFRRVVSFFKSIYARFVHTRPKEDEMQHPVNPQDINHDRLTHSIEGAYVKIGLLHLAHDTVKNEEKKRLGKEPMLPPTTTSPSRNRKRQSSQATNTLYASQHYGVFKPRRPHNPWKGYSDSIKHYMGFKYP